VTATKLNSDAIACDRVIRLATFGIRQAQRRKPHIGGSSKKAISASSLA
jgi:hypothetical protein